MIVRFLIAFLVFSATQTSTAWAAPTYPISELGSCRDAQECHLYCEIPAHKATCWAYQTYLDASPAVLGETTDADLPTPPALLFPISELGNCASVSECKLFCDISTNITTCQAFGKKKGLARTSPASGGASSTVGQQTALLAHAKEELGCTSLQQCRAFCNDPVNSEQCQVIASKYASPKYQLARTELLEKARRALACTTLEECRAFCATKANQAACQTFAAEQSPALFREKMRLSPPNLSDRAIPLPCSTLAACQAYCARPEHATACATARENGKIKINIQQEEKFSCNTKEECERFCQANPDQCPSYTRSKDYERVKLLQQLRTQVNIQEKPITSTDIEKYRRALLEKPVTSPTAQPTPSITPTN